MRQMFYKLLILLCVISKATTSFSQSRTISDEVLFKTGIKALPTNIDAFIESPSIGANEANDDYIYRLVQFYNMPTVNEQNRFLGSGIQFIEYIPNKAYLVAIPSNYNFSLLKSFNVRAITKMATQDKMNEYLRNEVYPDWSVEGEEVKLYVKLNRSIGKSDVLSAFLAKGAKVLDYYYRNNLVFIQTTKSATAIEAIAEIPFVNYVETVDPPGAREDTDGNGLNRSNFLKSNGLNYDGSGISIQTRDDGPVGPHIDFQGRIQMVDASSTGSHGDGVAGIFGGAGNLDPSQSGGATGAFMYVTDYVANFQDTTYGLHLYHGMNVTNSSYSNGCNAGYTATTQTVDNQIYTSPSLMHVFSAGNSNNNDCGYGAGNQWGNITGGHKIGKNVIATANLNSVGNLENSSSRGPASDGRLKPDLAAYGQGQGSTDENNTYQSFGGTSAASPSAAGVITQLMHAYKDMNGGQEPESALIKAAAMNTARDLGNAGPDYRFGWGLIDGRRAYNLLQENRYLTGTVAQGGSNTHTVTIPSNVVEARIMVYWMDPQGALSSFKALVNDLDMTVTDATGAVTQPLILDPTPNATTLNNTAIPGLDDLNNVEQVRLMNPTAGNYTVNIAGSVVPLGTRDYYVLYEFITNDIVITYPNGGEGLDPSQTARLHWDAYGSTGNFTIEYSIDNGVNWSTITVATSNSRLYNWNVPSVVSDQALIRITRPGGISDVSDAPFTIVGTPSGISIDTVCINGVSLSWNAVANASSYDVMFLGNQYMDSVMNTTSTSVTVPGNPYDAYWVSVRARYNNGVGERANAVFHPAGLKNCIVSDDVEIAIVSPAGSGSACSTDSLIVVQVNNLGTNDAMGGSISYQLNGGSIVTQTFMDTIPSGQSLIDTFSTLAPISAGGIYDLKTWVTLGADLIAANDTASSQFELFGVVSLPFTDNFESYNNCGTANNCGNTVCPLGNGWVNVVNGAEDDIDWRVDNNGTQSNGTGPSIDFLPGSTAGNYLYLEASGGCTGQTAELVSPCFDLTTAVNPIFEIAYHMFGGDMGSLHFDVYSNGVWTNDIVPAVSGNQGDIWNTSVISLSSYIGSIINIRVRGVTGNGFESDIAIDGFNIFDFSTAPSVAFSSNATTICPSLPIEFYDESVYFISSRKWVFTPNTVTFLNNTTDSSQNPVVSFNAQGQYDVKLVATNVNGMDSLIQTSYIDVNGGATLPFADDFESYANCGTANDCEAEICALGNGWINETNGSQDNIDWRVDNGGTNSNGTGPSFDHTSGTAAGNYLYLEASGGCNNRTAILTSPCIDLSSAVNPYFSLWYHMYGGDMGELHIDISANGGAWTNDIVTPITGDQGDQWLKLEIPLSAYTGQSIALRVRGITGTGFESDIAIDDFNVFDITTPPVAAMTVTNPCINGTIFEDNSTNGATSVSWDFGPNATPATAMGPGPHTVVFSSTNDQTVQLMATSPIGTDTLTQLVTNLSDVPAADFSWTTASETITITNTTIGGTSYFWNFGDGGTGNIANPNYTYSTSGLFDITLTATNDCGSNSVTRTVQIIVTDVENVSKAWNIDIFPNPNNGSFSLKLDGVSGDIEVAITDIQGKLIRNWNYTNVANGWNTAIDATDLASGIYIVKVQTDEGVKNVKLFVE